MMKSRAKYFLILILILSAYNYFAQDIDSLKLALKNAKHDTIRCKILNEMVEAETNDALWPNYNKELKSIAEKNISSASLPASLKKIYLQYLAISFNNIAFFYNSNGQTNEALDNCTKAMKIQEETGDKKGMAASLNTLAMIYEKQGQIKKALDHFMNSLKISEETGDKEGAAETLINIGLINQNLGQTKEALDHFERSLKICEEIADKEGMAVSLNNIGGIYHKAGDIKNALDHYLKGMKINEEIENEEGIANALHNIGTVYVRSGDLNKAIEYLMRCLAIYEKNDNKSGVVSALRNIGAVYMKQGKLDQAFNYANKGFELSNELGYPANIESSAHLMSVIYEKQGKAMRSLEMFKLYIQMRDSVKNNENQKAAFKKEAQYKYEKQRAEDSVATARDSQVKNAEIEKHGAELSAKKTQQYYLLGGLGLVLVFSGFMYNRFKITQKQKSIIEVQKNVVEEQKDILEEKQKEILDSIYYAKRIQTALMPSESFINRKFKENLNS